MARISTYPVKPKADGSDILLGTDASGGSKATKNFRIIDISDASTARYLSDNSWTFRLDAVQAAATKASIFFADGGGSETAWSNITTLRLQTLMGNNTISKPYLQFLLTGDPQPGSAPSENAIVIHDRNDLGSFGSFRFVSLTLVSGDVYEVEVNFIKGNGSIKEGHKYGFKIDTEADSVADKTFDFVQNVPSTTWNISHNLNKFPSITVVDSGNTVVIGSYEYIDRDNVTLSFSAAFAGKAYLN